MNKKPKIIIEVIIAVILLGALVSYFYYQFNINKTKDTSPELILSEITFNPAPDLDPALKQKYAERFIKIGDMINKDPNNLLDWLALASVMKGAKDYAGAEKVWLYIIQRWPDDPVAFGNLGDLYTNFLPDYPKAEWAYQKAIDVSSGIAEHLIYYRNLHELYKHYYQEKSDLADDILLEALERYPDELDFLALLATYYRDNKQKEKAIEYFEKLLEIEPNNQAAQRDLERLKNGS
jgi:tetratricopeptide (TPR) repeat protein